MPTDPKRILMIRPSALGDVCRSVPVLVSLRRAWPNARIDWVVRDTFAPAVAAHPALDNAIEFPRARFARWWRSLSTAAAMAQWAGALYRARYDLVIDCQGLSRSALMSLATGAPQRIGWRRAREFGWLAYTRRVEVEPQLHTVDVMLALIESLGIEPVRDMRLYVEHEAEKWWHAQRAQRGVAEPYVVLAPTTRWPSKRWPIEHWRALIKPLQQRGFASFVVVGAPDEARQVQTLVEVGRAEVSSVIGEADIARTMAVIAEAGLVIAHDSAPLHMAVGFDRPCVGLFGPTEPAIVGPYGGPSRVVTASLGNSAQPVRYRDRRLGDALMRTLTVEDVLVAVDELQSMTMTVSDASVASSIGDGQSSRSSAPRSSA